MKHQKSKTGSKTPTEVMDKIKSRLKEAEVLYAEFCEKRDKDE